MRSANSDAAKCEYSGQGSIPASIGTHAGQAWSLTPHQSVTKDEAQLAPSRDANRLVKAPPALRPQLMEQRTIDGEYHRGWAHLAAGTSGDCVGGSLVMPFGEHGQIAADIGKR
jgi:hypothetical protein